MFMSVLFTSLWSSQQPLKQGGFGNLVPNTPSSASPQGALELLELRRTNAHLSGQVQKLQTSLEDKNQERLELMAKIEAVVIEKAKFEAQIEQLRGSLAEQNKMVGMSRRPSVTSTASPTSSPIEPNMVSKFALETAQAANQNLEAEMASLKEQLESLTAQMKMPEARFKQQLIDEIEALRQLKAALTPLKSTVPKITGFERVNNSPGAAFRRESVVERALNGSFRDLRRGSVIGHNVPVMAKLRRQGSVAQAGMSSPLLEVYTAFENEEHASGEPFALDPRRLSPEQPEEVFAQIPLSQDRLETSFRGRHVSIPDVSHQRWEVAWKELDGYLERLSESTRATASTLLSPPMPETAAVAKLQEDMRALSTKKDQVEVTLDSARKELKRMTDMCIKFSREIGLDENYLPNIKLADDNSLVKILAKLGLDVHRVTTSDGGLDVGTSRLLKHLNQQLLPLGGEALIATDRTLNIVAKKVKSKGPCC